MFDFRRTSLAVPAGPEITCILQNTNKLKIENHLPTIGGRSKEEERCMILGLAENEYFMSTRCEGMPHCMQAESCITNLG